jgi:SAM-dependent methyltransferase
MEENRYLNTAHLYDLDPRDIVNDDIPFYINRAQQINGEILEVACGTGRVTLPLARAGFKITVFDLSDKMIDRLKHKLSMEDLTINERVELHIADMADFDFGKKFPLIIVPFRAFQLLTEEDQQNRFLDSVHKHLTDDGVFIINAYKPYTVMDENWMRPERENWVVEDKKFNTTVRRTDIRRTIDLNKQITYPELIYYVEEANGAVKRYEEKLAMKYYFEEQLRDLLLSRQFHINEELGYYDGRSIKEGPELIFVCST